MRKNMTTKLIETLPLRIGKKAWILEYLIEERGASDIISVAKFGYRFRVVCRKTNFLLAGQILNSKQQQRFGGVGRAYVWD
jgi:hypothetical protein